MTRLIFAIAFLLGAAAVVMMAVNFIESDTLALTVTIVIGVVYAIGAVELVQFGKATDTLSHALKQLTAETAQKITVLDEWLIKLHPSLQNAVRQRVEGDRIALPSPVLTPYLVSLLVMLGLLGTFVGLVETLKGVVLALEGSTELESIRQALTAPMGGLQLAFGTSVAGVAASAMLGLMSTLSRRERYSATRLLDNKIATDLRAHSVSHQRQETFKALQIQSESMPTIADKLDVLATRIEDMSDKLGERLVANQDQFHVSTKMLFTDLSEKIEKSISASVEQNDKVLSESGRLVGEGIRPVIEEAMSSLNLEINETTQNTQRHMSELVEAQLNTVSKDLSETSKQVSEAWQQAVIQNEQSNSNVVEAVKSAFETFSGSFAANSEKVLETVSLTASDWLQSERSSLQAINQDVANISSEFKQHFKAVNDSVVQQQQLAGEMLTSASQAMTQGLEAETNRILSKMAELLEASEKLVVSRIDSEQSWQQGHEQRMSDLTAAISGELNQLRDNESARAKDAVTQLETLQSTVASHLATLGKALEEPMTHLIETASETPKAAAEVISKLRQELSNNIERDNQLLEDRTRLIEQFDAASKSFANSSAGQLQSVEKLVDSSTELLKDVSQQFSENIGAEVGKVSEAADLVVVSSTEIASLGEAFNLAVNLFNESNDKLIASLDNIEGALEESTSRSDEQLGYYVAQAREVIDYSVSAQKEIFDELREISSDRTLAEVS